jgi:hypothetical protein
MHIEGALAVQNYGSSGSLLMQSLLDSHPNILCLPALHGHQLYVFWEHHGSLPIAQLKEKFLEQHAYWFDPSLTEDLLGLQQMGANLDEPTRIDRDAFVSYLGWDNGRTLSRKDYIASVYIAYAKALGRSLSANRYWLVFPIHGHHVPHAEFLSEDFDKAYFLHTVREPVQNMGSGVKHIASYPVLGRFHLLESNVRQELLEETIHVFSYDTRGIHYYLPDSEDGRIQSKSVRLEDLHKNSSEALSSIAQWLGISYIPEILLKSTFDGRIWNNRPVSVRQKGLGTGTITKKHNDIFNAFDQWRLKQLSRPIHLYYGYSTSSDFAPAVVRQWLLPVLILLPYKVELTYSHMRRVYPLVKASPDYLVSAVLRRLKARDLDSQAAVAVLLALNTVFEAVKGTIKSRYALLRAWKRSVNKQQEVYVPPVYLPGHPAASVAQKLSA